LRVESETGHLTNVFLGEAKNLGSNPDGSLTKTDRRCFSRACGLNMTALFETSFKEIFL
jgi:hypothetical protein